MMFDLRSWLRRSPKPRKLALHVDGEVRVVDLGKSRVKWTEVEQTVLNAGPQLVECLDEKNEILRSHMLEENTEDKIPPEDRLATNVAKSQQGNAAMLDAYGKRLVEAFQAGSEASAVMQRELVSSLTDVMGHFTTAIANMHTMSMNLAQLIQQNAQLAGQVEGDAGGANGDRLMGLVTALLQAKAATPAAPPPPNGGAKR